jgi:hypothetical protein
MSGNVTLVNTGPKLFSGIETKSIGRRTHFPLSVSVEIHWCNRIESIGTSLLSESASKTVPPLKSTTNHFLIPATRYAQKATEFLS